MAPGSQHVILIIIIIIIIDLFFFFFFSLCFFSIFVLAGPDNQIYDHKIYHYNF